MVMQHIKPAQDWFADADVRRRDYLAKALGGADYTQTAMTSDMAPRFYHRIKSGEKHFVLMESAPDGHPQALVGHEIGGFIAVQNLLKAAGIRVPEIYDADAAAGLLLLEDFGSVSFEKALGAASSFSETERLYQQAADMLFDLKAIPAEVLEILPPFKQSRIYQFGRRFADWFLPYYYGRRVSDDDIAAFQTMMADIEATLPTVPAGFVHGDFQPPNMMILDDGSLGLLDFQGALLGPGVYDLVNLLHDARRCVDPRIIRQVQEVYFLDEKSTLSSWYEYLSLHFHLRVIGQFIRVGVTLGRMSYVDHLDRLRGYLHQNQNPIFQSYCKNAGLDFSSPLPPLDLEVLKPLIRDDAS